MKFFIDTANLNEIREAASLGILDGVTTNPSLIAKEAKEGKVDFHEHIHTICELVNGPVSAEVTDETLDGMLKQGRELARIHPNVTVKVPLTKDGLKACSALTKEGTKVNVTLCFSAGQALLAAKSGATFISPFVGRLDDIGDVGMDVISDIVQIYDNYGYGTEVLAASIRSPLHVIEAAKYGADVATIPFKIIDMLFRHPLTDKGMEQFMADWKKGGLK